MEILLNLCRLLGRIGLYLAAPFLVAILCYIIMYKAFIEAPQPGETKTELVQVSSGSSFKDICKDFQSKGLIKHWWTLEIIARLKHADTKIKEGEYELSPGMTPREILSKLVAGEVFKRILVLKEGFSMRDLAKLCEDSQLLSRLEMEKALTNQDLLKQSGIEATSFEGYLFPNSYYFSRPITPQRILGALLEESKKRWKPEYQTRAEELGMTRHEVLTLASIIEKESGNPEEQPVIAAVFYNRLKSGMRLQSDPTVIYGVENFDGNITKKMLEAPTPYNTYTNFGLPPGPICNPGETAIRSALWPAEGSQYLFFVADGRGGHVFSTTKQEHDRAVAEYVAIMRLRNSNSANPPALTPPAVKKTVGAP